jgi:hypothetical protein
MCQGSATLTVESEGRESEGRDPGEYDAISAVRDGLGISALGSLKSAGLSSEPFVG